MKKKQKKTVTAFDPTKPVETRDGRKARILATDKKGKYPIVALIMESSSGMEEVHLFSAKGIWNIEGTASSYDLVNVPEKFRYKKWVNFYPCGRCSAPHESKEIADAKAEADRCACVEVNIDFAVGDGL